METKGHESALRSFEFLVSSSVLSPTTDGTDKAWMDAVVPSVVSPNCRNIFHGFFGLRRCRSLVTYSFGICSSFAPSRKPKSLATNVTPITRHHTRIFFLVGGARRNRICLECEIRNPIEPHNGTARWGLRGSVPVDKSVEQGRGCVF